MPLMQKLGAAGVFFKFDNWPMLLLGRTFDRRTGLVTYRKDGLEILIDHRGGDQNGTRSCLVSDMYRRHLAGMLGEGPVRVLDIGANGGGFPLMLLLEGFDVEQAVCVEMNPPTYLRLMVNLATNLGSRATGINAAVCGVANQEILLQPSRGSTGLSMHAHRADASASHVSVPTTTLAALCDEYFSDQPIDICKIDIEGAEFEALAATPDTVLSKIRNLIIEFHDPVQAPACMNRLLSLGFADATGQESARTGEKTEVRVYRRTEAIADRVNPQSQAAAAYGSHPAA
jgi:FkbM family methyltransferase